MSAPKDELKDDYGDHIRAKKPRLDPQKDKEEASNASVSSPAESHATSPLSVNFDDEELEKNLKHLLDADPYKIPVWPKNIDGKPVELNVDTLMQHGGFVELRMIIEWAKKLTEFRKLEMDDQMALLKASFLEINVLRLAFRSMDYFSQKKCNFFDGMNLSLDEAANLGWGLDLVNCTLDFSRCLKDCEVDRTEFAIINAIVLSFPDAAGVQDNKAVTELQNFYLNILRQYIKKNYTQDKQRYGKILLKLPLLRTTSAKAAERFLKMSLDGTIQLNNLVWEMMA